MVDRLLDAIAAHPVASGFIITSLFAMAILGVLMSGLPDPNKD